MSTALSLDFDAQQHRLKAKFDQGQRNKSAREQARKAASNLDVQPDDDLVDLFAPADGPGQRAHTRVLVVVDPVADGYDAVRPSRAPAIESRDPQLIGYKKEVMWLAPGPDGSTTLEPITAEEHTRIQSLENRVAVLEKANRPEQHQVLAALRARLAAMKKNRVTVFTSLEKPAVEARAALRQLMTARAKFGPTEAWSVYGRWQGKRVQLLVVGSLSYLRYYWPDAMTRKRLKAAGVNVAELGQPLQIRKHIGPTVATPSNQGRR